MVMPGMMQESAATTTNMPDSPTDLSRDDEPAAMFSRQYKAVTSSQVSESEYCLHLATSPKGTTVGVAVSGGPLVLLERDTLETVATLKPHQDTPTGLRFSPTDANILWSSGLDGLVKMWDIRTGQSERQFSSCKDESSLIRPLTCLDLSGNERVLCGGTELTEEGAFILFWDVRGDKFLGVYSDSHTDDVTQVKFSPKDSDTLASSATDGLINIFDISQRQEVDALTYCLKTEETVDKLYWLSEPGGEERLAGLTDVETLQYWDIKEAAPLHQFSRQDIAAALKHKHSDDCYLVSIDVTGDYNLAVLTGVRSENCGDRLRTLTFQPESGELKPHGSFITKQELFTTRCSLYHMASDTYMTGSEGGILRLWRPELTQAGGKLFSVKAKKERRKKPY